MPPVVATVPAPIPASTAVLLPEALARTRPLLRLLGRTLPGALIGYVGELRRGREVIRRADVLVAVPDPASALERVAAVLGAEVRLADGELVLDVRGLPVCVAVVGPTDLGGETFRRTGSPEVVQEVELRLAERGALHRAFASEASLLAAAGLAELPPEARERAAVVRLAAEGRLDLVQRADVRAFLHVHTTWSDGQDDLATMAEEAARRGALVVGIADHSRSAGYAGGLSIARLAEQGRAIALLNQRLAGVRVLHGTECDILDDGRLDFPDRALEGLDFVVASVHTSTRQPQAQMTARICRALTHPKVRILAHPTARLLLAREPMSFDLEAVLTAAEANDVAVEVNANPARLDLDWRHHELASRLGVKLALGVDAHEAAGLSDVDYAVHIVRKGLVPPSQVINTWEPDRLIAWLHRA